MEIARHLPELPAARASRRTVLAWSATGAALGVLGAGPVLSTAAQDAPPPGPFVPPTPLGEAIPPEVAEFATDWPMLHGNYAATRAATGATITAANVSKLGVAWRFPLAAFGAYGAITCNPVIVGPVVYIQDMASNIFALDRDTGEEVWEHRRDQPGSGPNGVAVGYGLVFGADFITRQAFALDAASGEVVWEVTLSENPREFISYQPIVYDNIVYFGTSGASYLGGAKGDFFALDAATGGILWRWDPSVDNLWGSARINSGGGLWYGPAVDETGNIYFGIGNPGPWPGTEAYPNGSSRPGDNLYSSSMVSLDTATGSLRWYIQARPHDLVDADFQNTPLLTTVAIDGVPTPLAIGSGKAGLVIAANAETGEELWRVPVGEHRNYPVDGELPIDEPVEVLPGAFGGVLTPAAYADGTVFLPVVNWAMSYTATAALGPSTELIDAAGAMVALDAATGETKWETAVPTLFAGGATVANDLVFGAGLDGVVRGFDTATGDEVWQFQALAGVNSTLAIAGDLLVVPAGGFFFNAENPTGAPLATEVIGLRLGATGATPIAGADAGGTPAADPAPANEATPVR